MATSFYAPSLTSRTDKSYFYAGLTFSYPNLTSEATSALSDLVPLPCQDFVPGCKVFRVSNSSGGRGGLEATEVESEELGEGDLKDQVLVFRFGGKVYAVDHRCPHSSYPLSRGTPFDIEDFGIKLSAGLRCPKHDWSFDLVRGNGDRGNYRLGIWEVQLRDVAAAKSEIENEKGDSNRVEEEAKEVWIRRKQRMG